MFIFTGILTGVKVIGAIFFSLVYLIGSAMVGCVVGIMFVFTIIFAGLGIILELLLGGFALIIGLVLLGTFFIGWLSS